MIKKIHSCYFSATGTTKKTVGTLSKLIASKLHLPIFNYDFTTKEARQNIPNFEQNDLIIMGTPVIAGRVPNLLLPFLQSLKAEGCYGIPIVLYGNRNYDDALIELTILMQNAEIKVIGAGAFIGEHSFSTILGAGRPDNKDLNILEKFANQIINKIHENSLNLIEEIPGDKTLSVYYKPRDRHGNHIDIRKVKPKTNENCTKCMLCANICPLLSISFEDVSQVTGICMKCCACIKRCPENAKYFDDPGYLYHKTELEEQYANIRREPEYFI